MDFQNNHRHFLKRFFGSFKYAWSGLVHVIRNEQNMKFHLLIATIIISLAVILKVPPIEKLILLVVIGTVMALEVMNTAIERVVDLVTKEYHPLAKTAKDVSAGAVLVFSIFAAIIGVFIFFQPVVDVINHYL